MKNAKTLSNSMELHGSPDSSGTFWSTIIDRVATATIALLFILVACLTEISGLQAMLLAFAVITPGLGEELRRAKAAQQLVNY